MKSCKECGNERCLLNATEGYCLECPECGVNWKDRKMEFDKSRVFTSVNADELEVGDKVIVADTMAELKRIITGEIYCIAHIMRVNDEDCENRFCIGESNATGDITYPLAYLVERKENCLKCKKCEVISDKSMHCDWVGTGPITSARVEKCNHYEPKTGKKEMCLNCKHYNKVNDFRDCTLVNNPTGSCPHYEAEKHYRPFKDTDELIKVWGEKEKKVWGYNWLDNKQPMPLIWVRRKESNCKGQLITKFSDPSWVIMSTEGYNMTDLFEHFTFLDGSPCGVEE